MERPPTYQRAGRAIIKRPRGSLYLAQDIDPILDEIERQQAKRSEENRLFDDRRIENDRLIAQAEELTKTIVSLESELDRVSALLEKAETYGDILADIKKMLP